jgi:hypothetical protein
MSSGTEGQKAKTGILGPSICFIMGSVLGGLIVLLMTPKSKSFRLSRVQQTNEGLAFEDSVEYELIGMIAEAINSIERNVLKLSDNPQALSLEERTRLLQAIESAKDLLRVSMDKLKHISRRSLHFL